MKMRKGWTALAVIAATSLIGTSAHAVILELGNATAPAEGEPASFTVTLRTEGAEVVGTENEIAADRNVAVFRAITVNTTLVNAISASDTSITLADVSDLPAFGIIQIDDERISYGRVNRNTGTLSQVKRGEDGTTAAAHAAGAAVSVPTDLPDCAANPNLNKDAAFAFIPPGCDPDVDCTGVKAVVIRVDKDDPDALSPIPNNSVLYSCSVTVRSDGDLVCSEPRSSDAGGTLNDPTTCPNGMALISTGPQCTGDKNSDGAIDGDELNDTIRAFSRDDVSLNPAADTKGGPDGTVDGDELNQVIRNFSRDECNLLP